MHEAKLYHQPEDNKVQCTLCHHHCVIPQGETGVCRVRSNINGRLMTLVYGKTISQHVDPVEKKPLYHYLPGSMTYSVATPGCNFQCQWCQNWGIVHMPVKDYAYIGRKSSPEELVAAGRGAKCRSLAYTYTEPTVFFEYAYDTARKAHKEGLKNLYITNGYMSREMLETFQPYLDAANVDLKAFRERTYQRYVGASLQPILDNLKLMSELGMWLEVTTLLIPDLNDDPQELRDAARFINQELGPETPWHVSRFIPHHEMQDRPPTSLEALERAREIGREEGLMYVYLGNVQGESNTYCPSCGELLLRRVVFGVAENRLVEGRCPSCGMGIAGVWE